MKQKTFMLIAGEPSGDLLAAELVGALRDQFAKAAPLPEPDFQPLHASLAPRFFGVGGPRMEKAGVELSLDLTAHAAVGLVEVLKHYAWYRRLLYRLLRMAIERQPDAIICVDFSGFNRRFGHAVKRYVRAHEGPFNNWNPKLIQYVSPQVWASRESRARKMARDFDLLLSIFPFEKDWYAKHASTLRVEYVGNPILDRHAAAPITKTPAAVTSPLIVLLPGSRPGELARHMPVLRDAAKLMALTHTAQFKMCLPNETLTHQATEFKDWPPDTTIQTGGLSEALAQATIAIASTGTVTMECAFFGVPAVTLYKTSWSTYQIGKRLIQVNFLSMPNLLAGEAVYPEFIQEAAKPQNIARAALAFLQDPSLRETTRAKLTKTIRLLGPPGASRRAAQAILRECSIVST